MTDPVPSLPVATGRFSRIAGTGGYLPGVAISNAELVERLASRGIESSDDWIVERTGIRSRHFASDQEQCSDLALVAARRALESADCDAASIDLIIVATSTPDMVFPSTACILQKKLGAFGSPAFDVQAVCAGFVYALTVADSMIRNGAASKALVMEPKPFRGCSTSTIAPPASCSVMARAPSSSRPATGPGSSPASCTPMVGTPTFCARRVVSRAARSGGAPC